MGNKQSESSNAYQKQNITKTQLDSLCAKVQGHLELLMQRKQDKASVKIKELLNMVSASERNREFELNKMAAIQADINFVSGLQILIRYLLNIQQRSQMIVSTTSVDSLQFLLPLLLGIIWASPLVCSENLTQISNMIKVFLQDSEFLQNLEESPFIEAQLRKCFRIIPSNEYSIEINSLAILLAQQGLNMQVLNLSGHGFQMNPEEFHNVKKRDIQKHHKQEGGQQAKYINQKEKQEQKQPQQQYQQCLRLHGQQPYQIEEQLKQNNISNMAQQTKIINKQYQYPGQQFQIPLPGSANNLINPSTVNTLLNNQHKINIPTVNIPVLSVKRSSQNTQRLKNEQQIQSPSTQNTIQSLQKSVYPSLSFASQLQVSHLRCMKNLEQNIQQQNQTLQKQKTTCSYPSAVPRQETYFNQQIQNDHYSIQKENNNNKQQIQQNQQKQRQFNLLQEQEKKQLDQKKQLPLKEIDQNQIHVNTASQQEDCKNNVCSEKLRLIKAGNITHQISEENNPHKINQHNQQSYQSPLENPCNNEITSWLMMSKIIKEINDNRNIGNFNNCNMEDFIVNLRHQNFLQ